MDNPTAEASAQIELFQNQWAEFEKDVFMEKIAIYGVIWRVYPGGSGI